MTDLLCANCGGPAALIPIGPNGIVACPACDEVRWCVRCGQATVSFDTRSPPDRPASAAPYVCSTCLMRERADALPAQDVQAIRAAARHGVLSAVKVAKERLAWPLKDTVELVHVLCPDVEYGRRPAGGE